MKDFDRFLEQHQRTAASARKSGQMLGAVIPWLMIAAGVIVTAIQTHSLAYDAMRGSALYAGWLDLASWLPVVLLEGTAIGLSLGRLYFFKGTAQRHVGHGASFVVWGVLAVNTVARFATSDALGGQTMPAPLLWYARYVLPLSIVAVPYLWKWLLDLHPDSQQRIATLAADAAYREQLLDIYRTQNEQVAHAYREAMESPEVRQALSTLTTKAAVQRATKIVGLIDDEPAAPAQTREAEVHRFPKTQRH